MGITPAELSALAARITPVEETWLQAGRARQDDLTKPPGLARRAGGRRDQALWHRSPVPATGSLASEGDRFRSRPRGVCAGSHTVAQEVSVQMAAGIAIGFAGVSVISRAFGAEVEVFDVGLLQHAEGTTDRRIAAGTADFTQGPAMTREQALAAVSVASRLPMPPSTPGLTCWCPERSACPTPRPLPL